MNPNTFQKFVRKDISWLDIPPAPSHIIKEIPELENELQYPQNLNDIDILVRVTGSMAGLALGDALGAHVEFKPYEMLSLKPVKDLQGGGTWGLDKGQFTDDTSMALCLANSLIVCRDFCPYDQLVRYKWWFQLGYMSSTGRCFDIGGATKRSLLKFEQRQEDFCNRNQFPHEYIDYLEYPSHLGNFDVMCSDENVAGNGALMRLAPIALFFYRFPTKAIEYSAQSAKLTHADKRAYDACRYYCALIVAALRGEKKNQLLHKKFYENHKEWFGREPLHEDIIGIMQGSYKKEGGYSQGIRGTGYVVNALEAALWAFYYDRDSFEKGALAAVNLGDDTDTTASIYGQLAGAYYGYKKLPNKWLRCLHGKAFIKCLSQWLVYEGEQWHQRQLATSKSTLSAHTKDPNIPISSVEKNQNISARVSSRPVTLNSSINVTSGSEKNEVKTSYPNIITPNTTTSSSSHYVTSVKSGFGSTTCANNSTSSSPRKKIQQINSVPVPQTITSPKQIQNYQDVYSWFMNFGPEYYLYADNIRKHKVDGWQLLYYMNQEKLSEYGIQNAQHQRRILDAIDVLRKQYTVTPIKEHNDYYTVQYT